MPVGDVRYNTQTKGLLFVYSFGIADSSPYGNIYPEAADNISGRITTMSSTMIHT